MALVTRTDRIVGSLIGALIGDALGVGPHWYKSFEPLKADYGPWIDNYVAPLPHRYHAGLKPGDYSQTGQVYMLLLESVAECGEYQEADFTQRVDGLLATLSGRPAGGRFTDVAMRDLWHARHAGLSWSEAVSFADTAEAAIRGTVLAGRYLDDLKLAIQQISANILLTHKDPFIVGQSLGFGLNVCALMHGIPVGQAAAVLTWFDSSHRRPSTAPPTGSDGQPLPVPAGWRSLPSFDYSLPVTWLGRPGRHEVDAPSPQIGFYDAAGGMRGPYQAVKRGKVISESAPDVCELFGLGCALTQMLPQAYRFVSLYENDFEMAVLSAVNSVGNNMACAALTGALSGALVGINGIPERFVTGLADHEHALDLAGRIALASAKGAGEHLEVEWRLAGGVTGQP